MRRAEANLRVDDIENGHPEEAGNDLHSEENVMSHPQHVNTNASATQSVAQEPA